MAKAAAGGRKKSKYQPPPPVHWPPIPEDTYGWRTEIGEDMMVTKEDVLDLYHLNEQDIADLKYKKKSRENGGYFKQYNEREIELLAWKKHGGPVGLWHFLKGVEEEYANADGEEFSPPRSYEPGQLYDLSKEQPPVVQDRYVRDSSTMRYIKNRLPLWFWATCNLELNETLEGGKLPTDVLPERKSAMRRALAFYRSRPWYSGRPQEPISTGKSLAIINLRALLSKAPCVPSHSSAWGWGDPVEGLVYHNSDTADYYEWSQEYLDRLFNGLSSFIKQAGLGDDGWRSARWEVYYKYIKSFGEGLRYDPDDEVWWDTAGVWLKGRVSQEELQNNLRDSPAGIAYNDLLPELAPSSTQTTAGAPGFVAGSSSAPG